MDREASALAFISPVERDKWVAMAMALRSEFGDAALDTWLDWSRGADSFRERDAMAVWKSCKGQGITMGTLYHEAKQAGWQDDSKFQKPTASQLAARRQEAAQRASREGQARVRLARQAAEKAEWILGQCKSEKHAYLHSKGFQDLEGAVWRPDDKSNLLCIPMRIDGKISSLQMIDKEGVKKFLTDGIASQAEYRFVAGRLAADYWCEGFATGLSLRACLHALSKPYRIHVTFSAHNLKRMAHSGYVIADHDINLVGEAAAKETGLPYWLAPEVGTDLNDLHKASGTFKTSQVLGKWLRDLQTK